VNELEKDTQLIIEEIRLKIIIIIIDKPLHPYSYT